MNINTLSPLRETIRRHNLLARKSLGQHFLLDSNITEKIVRVSCIASALSGQLNVIEIGPGPGGLTRSLLASDAQHVYAIEKDDRCMAALLELKAIFGEKFTVLMQDALTFDIPGHIPWPRAIVANLPYNIGTRLLLNWLDDIARLGTSAYISLTLMFQKEVAQRLYAKPDTSDYGRLSVMTQWLCNVEYCFDLPASAFIPPPKVASTVVRITPREHPLAPADRKSLQALLAAAFGQRRKMLRSALATFAPRMEEAFRASAIDSTRRAETLSVEEFCKLSTCISA